MNNKSLIWSLVAVVVLVVAGLYFYMEKGQAPTVGDNYALPSLSVTPTPTGVVTAAPAASKVWDVEITSAGFNPKTLDIKKGDTVRWTNKGTATAWPASAMHPTHNVYPQHTGICKVIGGSDFDACRGLATGESWSFKFDYVGSWGYHDHLNASHFGKINVAE